MLEVATYRTGPCGECSEQGCSLAPLGGRQAARETVRARNRCHARTQDRVLLELEEGQELRVSLAVWGLPMVGMVAGAVLGMLAGQHTAANADTTTLLGAAVGFAGCVLGLRWLDRRLGRNGALLPVAVRVMREPHCDLDTSEPHSL
jgi:sigma-E factor negative regulatory protein RseC